MNFDDRLRQMAATAKADRKAAYRARVERTNAALGIHRNATPAEVHEALTRKANGN